MEGWRPDWRYGLILVAACTVQGCASHAIDREVARIAFNDMPRELSKVSHPIYRVEPPDILLIDAVNNIRPANSPLHAGDTLTIRLQNGLPLDVKSDPQISPLEYQFELEQEVSLKIINGEYTVDTLGDIDFGPAYGSVRVDGLTVEQAQAAIEQHLRDKVGLLDPRLTVFMPNVSGKQAVTGEHLVRPDGTISMGIYGDVPVAGRTLMEVKYIVESHLSQFMHDPEVQVDVLAYNSKVYYVIMDGGGYGEQVIRLPCTGNETVLDAIAQVQGLSQVSSKKIWIARPAPSEYGHAQILDVHWEAIAAEGVTTTNYQIFPGDRIYVKADHLIATDNLLGKLFAPVERTMGLILLSVGAAQRIDFYSQGPNSGGFGGGGGGGP